MAAVHASYYTDPACPWSWSVEPVVRRLQVEFGDSLEFTYVMCGIAREFGPPLDMVGELLDAGDASGMPVDPRLWLDSPPASSHPACLAVKAAGEQGPEIEALYLRRLREGLNCARRKLDSADALTNEARAVPGLNVERFGIDLRSNATVEALGADLERAAAVDAAQHAEGSGRVRVPSIEFAGADGQVHGVYGPRGYEEYAAGALAAGAQSVGDDPPGVAVALRRFGSMATPEVAAVCGLPGPRAPAELWRLAAEWAVRAERRGTGELWSLA